MKRILITGANSYIGSTFERCMQVHADSYSIDAIDMVDGSWRKKSFSGYDVVFHVAGIVHENASCASGKQKYYAINVQLAIDTARKAQVEGVRQFIFMSSASVYGDGAPIGKTKYITQETQPAPSTIYGESKLLAEKGLSALQSPSFRVVIVRAPMVYGRGCKGNYAKLSRLARVLPAFPLIANERSMIYIGNLCEFVRLMILHEESGIFHPQNEAYANTSELVRLIAELHGKKLLLFPGLKPALVLASHMLRSLHKAFGDFCYDKSLSEYKTEYRIVSLEQSIRLTELGAERDDAGEVSMPAIA